MKALLFSFFLLIVTIGKSPGQTGSNNFHHLTVNDGLHDGIIKCIGEDKFGYIWIGSVGAWNRFDGKSIQHFTNIPGDTNSPYGGQPRCIHSNQAGRLWLGNENGLMEYRFENFAFRRIKPLQGIYMAKIISQGDSLLFLATSKGLIKYWIKKNETFFYSNSNLIGHKALKDNRVRDFVLQNQTLSLATNSGLVQLDIKTDHCRSVQIPKLEGIGITSVAIDGRGNFWLGAYDHFKLAKFIPGQSKTIIYDSMVTRGFSNQELDIVSIQVDSKNRVWVITNSEGLLQFDENQGRFLQHLHNDQLFSSPAANNYWSMYLAKNGLVWLGCDYQGVDFFDPDKRLFSTLFPFPDRLNEGDRRVARAVTEDQQGNIWMGSQEGVSRYNPKNKTYTIWRNEENKPPKIGNNMVRAMLCDTENNIWIGTSDGVNRFNQQTQKMEFVSENHLPRRFFNSINTDKSGKVWFCTNDSASLYWYTPATKKFDNISNHPQLKIFKGLTPTSYVLEDSKQRLWISLARKGVAMFDQNSLKIRQFMIPEAGEKGIIGNQVVDIKEDAKGLIWVSTLNGVSGIDVENDSFISFNNKNGLPGNFVSPLVIDSLDRIWLGVTGGLTMIDKDRKSIVSFSLSDGLSSIGFPEHAGVKLANGDIIFPSYNGFIRFNPLAYKAEKHHIDFYLKSYSIEDKTFFNIQPDDPIQELNLKANQNFFTLNLVALNFETPEKTWFAFKLEGFDDNWRYSQNPTAVYTNVAGGQYKFVYKAAENRTELETVQAKTLVVTIGTAFYKSFWFWGFFGLAIFATIYSFYSYRARQRNLLFQLDQKAQLLEKEKALVMYENLKQHLNPHFLFNSLTSLGSLIRLDQTMATDFLDKMSKVYRYVLKNRNNETVPLSDELNFVAMYIKLQKTRFEEGLQIKVQIDDAFLYRRIAPVTLQNLVENAIKHNITDTDSPLFIELKVEDDYLICSNNLQKKNFVETSNKQGLANMISLYRFMSPRPVVVSDGPTHFMVKIPLL